MNKKEFLELANRFQNDDCSDFEKNLLFEYCKQAQIKKWDLTEEEEEEEEEEETRIRLLRDIYKNIKSEPVHKLKTYTWRKIIAVAAFFIGLMVGFYFYNQGNLNTTVFSSDQISLQLENGKVIIIKDSLSDNIYTENGQIIARVENNSLVYTKEILSNKTESNTLYIPNGKTFNLQLTDGTQIKLNAGASIKYPVNFLHQKYREVAITGEAYLEVAKDSLQPFIVNLGELNVKVFGTRFNIENYENNLFSEVVLAEGSVGLYTNEEELAKKPMMLLSPGYKAGYDKINKNLSKQKVNIQSYIAWKDGELIYKNLPFKQILKKLERHFDVRISCKNKTLSEELFNANFGKNPSLNQVLKDFKLNYGIDYTIDDKDILIK